MSVPESVDFCGSRQTSHSPAASLIWCRKPYAAERVLACLAAFISPLRSRASTRARRPKNSKSYSGILQRLAVQFAAGDATLSESGRCAHGHSIFGGRFTSNEGLQFWLFVKSGSPQLNTSQQIWQTGGRKLEGWCMVAQVVTIMCAFEKLLSQRVAGALKYHRRNVARSRCFLTAVWPSPPTYQSLPGLGHLWQNVMHKPCGKVGKAGCMSSHIPGRESRGNTYRAALQQHWSHLQKPYLKASCT